MKKPKLRIGDIFEVKTPKGLVYGQYTHDGGDMGDLIRLLPGIYSDRPDDFSTLADQQELYSVFFTLERAVKDRQVEIVSNQPLPERVERFPVMRKRGAIDRSGRTLSWLIGHGLKLYTLSDMQQATQVRDLTPGQKKLSIAVLMAHSALVEAVSKGWTPERDEELNIASRQRAQSEAKGLVERFEHLKTIEHYLYFHLKKNAQEAARRLTAKGWIVDIRMGADGENWLTLAKQPAPLEDDIEKARDELETITNELDGQYDGWGAPVRRDGF